MIQDTSIAALIQELDRRSPAGLAMALHIRFATPSYLLNTYPKRWLDQYSAQGMVLHDPTVRWGMHNVGFVRWSDLEKIDSGEVLERAKDYGLMNGLAVALVQSGSRSIASFARADRDYDGTEISDMVDMFELLHQATAARNRICEHDRKVLSDLSVRLTR